MRISNAGAIIAVVKRVHAKSPAGYAKDAHSSAGAIIAVDKRFYRKDVTKAQRYEHASQSRAASLRCSDAAWNLRRRPLVQSYLRYRTAAKGKLAARVAGQVAIAP